MSKLLVAKDTNQAKNLSSLLKQNKIRRICKGLYTDDLHSPMGKVILSHWMQIVSHIVPDGVLCFRTAIDLKPTPFQGETIVFITSSYSKTIALPGLVIKILKGNSEDYTEQVLPNIARSNVPRMLLENLTVTRAPYKNIKTIGADGVEIFLAKELIQRNEKVLNEYRDAAKAIADDLGYRAEYEKLNEIIRALLSTHEGQDVLTTPYATAFAKKEPFDRGRIELFEKLVVYIKKCRFKNRAYEYNKISFRNIAFFESYFSNFIEGTEFTIDEAEKIAFQGAEINNRHADSHDVLSIYRLCNDYSEMTTTPRNPDELLDILQKRHAYIMDARPDKRPGSFKERANRAGSTHFVAPAEVVGTLSQGFEYYRLLNEGLEKALFMHLLVSEVHPFDDGNGRLSRIMLNAELVRAGLDEIIIPSANRDNYLNGLRLASRDHDFRIYCKVMDQAQAYVGSIDWLFYGKAREKIEKDGANLFSDEGLPTFNRALQNLSLSDFA